MKKDYHQSTSPQSLITSFLEVLPRADPHFSSSFTTSIPSTTFPKTTCFPSNHSVFAVQIKNCDPFVFGPLLAIESIPGPVCFKSKFSSGNCVPYIDLLPVPSPLIISP